MQVVLIGENELHKITLPKIVEGIYWIKDNNDQKLINIEANEGFWQITSDDNFTIINSDNISIKNNRFVIEEGPQVIVKQDILEEYETYGIASNVNKKMYLLYCMPVCDSSFIYLRQKNINEILIGRDKHNHIIFRCKFASLNHAKLIYNNDSWTIVNNGFGTYVNNKILNEKSKLLKNGDIIFIFGLKIIILGNGFFINSTEKIVLYNKYYLEEYSQNMFLEKDISESDDSQELYNESDYFSRAPKITKKIETEKIKIDSPPAIQNNEQMPAILVLGTTLSMSAVMLVSVYQTIDGLISGEKELKSSIFSLVIVGLMLITMLLFPILQIKYEKKKKIRYEKKRQKKYKKYINSKIKEIDKILIKQKYILFNNYASTKECLKIALTRNNRLWERKIEDDDFLRIRLGLGEVPLDIDILYPEKGFAMDDDNLVEYLNQVANKSKVIKNAPITVSLVEKNISAIISDDEKLLSDFIKKIILQLVTFQDYSELKLVFFMKEDTNKKWDYVKMLPHLWSNSKDIRFFADNYDDMKEISRYLEDTFEQRKYTENADKKIFIPHYLIITDDFKTIEKLKFVSELVKSKLNFGFSILCLTDNFMKLPNECKTFIKIQNDEGIIYENEVSSANQKETNFIFEKMKPIDFSQITKSISNVPIKYIASDEVSLPNIYTFLEMYDVGTIEQLNILERWRRSDSTISLKAPIGIDDSGMKIMLDIHEKFHGPHGLIAGSTGSGKSEFIITYLLSLAINYHPDDLAIIIIDYKGGGLAGAFKKRNIQLPHLVGTITNIDTVGLSRSLDSIQSELKRRQIIFNEARNLTNEGTIDIYKYQKLYHNRIVKEPIPHLLIICDEFAELKQQQQDFMDELISVARIGRSLGVHLILATQKPAGIVNDQIRSNSRFGICLKVQEKEDSMDVIKRPDAANLKNSGQFYMQVGNDEYFVLGQSAWAGAPYIPSNIIKNKVDLSLEFISNTGIPIKKADDAVKRIINDEGAQITNIVKYIYELSTQNGIKLNQLWLDTIPETIFIKDLREKYKIDYDNDGDVAPIIGEFDDPLNQNQGIVRLNYLKNGNTIIYGNADSGKETLLSTICYDSIMSYSPDKIQFYILDFGSESLKIFKSSHHVGDVIFATEDEKIDRFFNMISDIYVKRKKLLSDYNGNYDLYINSSGKSMPIICIVINSYEAFSEYYNNKYEDIVSSLTRDGLKVGIVFILAVSTYNNVRYRLSQNFKQKITLQLNNNDEYYNILDGVGKKRPSSIFGRGLIPISQNIYEFQTAKICEPENWVSVIKSDIEKINKKYKTKAIAIPTMPDMVVFEDVKSSYKSLKTLPLGIIKDSLKVYTYDLIKNYVTIISSRNIEDSIKYVHKIADLIKKMNNTKIYIFDADNISQSTKVEFENNYKKFANSVINNLDSDLNIVCIYIGIDKFLNYFDDGESKFKNLLEKTYNYGNYKFIIVENVVKLKNHEFDQWFKSFVTRDTGIWVGNGLDDQYLLNIGSGRREIINNCGESYGYVVNQGEYKMIKLYGVKDRKDEV